jgi:hypothetical protein
MKRALLIAGTLAWGNGCTLLVDVDEVRRTRGHFDAGASDGGAASLDGGGLFDAGGGSSGAGGGSSGAGGGSSGAGGGSSGTGGGSSGTGGGSSGAGGGSFDSGVVDAGPYDGGPRCASSLRPRLRCDPPLVLANTGAHANAVLQSLPEGLLAGWSTSTAVKLGRVHSDGGQERVVDVPATGVARLMLATEGSAWALLYQGASNQPLWCYSGLDDGGVSPGASTAVSAVAVTAAGGVAVAISTGSGLSAGLTSAGCPRSPVHYAGSEGADWVGAVHLPGTGPEGFRFTSSALTNGYNGSVGIWAPAADGGLDNAMVIAHYQGIEDHAATLSANGQYAIISYSFYDTDDHYHLGVRALATSLAQPVDSSTVLPDPASFWNNATCGPGCVATLWAPSNSPSHVAVVFTSDDSNTTALTTSPSGWDVACSTSLQNTSVAAAMHQGRLWVLVGEDTRARLFACDVPPLAQ